MNIKLDTADLWFSKYIRLRDGECKRCLSKVGYNVNGDPVTHQNSHFQGRRKEATRYDIENCDCLCGGCHQYFTANPGEHYMWQVAMKGQSVVDAIIVRSNSYMKKDRKMAAMVWRQAYKDLKGERNG
jgi:hypothetical protein